MNEQKIFFIALNFWAG